LLENNLRKGYEKRGRAIFLERGRRELLSSNLERERAMHNEKFVSKHA
jgi:hypothetical protein